MAAGEPGLARALAGAEGRVESGPMWKRHDNGRKVPRQRPKKRCLRLGPGEHVTKTASRETRVRSEYLKRRLRLAIGRPIHENVARPVA